jgi:hypothetical protein
LNRERKFDDIVVGGQPVLDRKWTYYATLSVVGVIVTARYYYEICDFEINGGTLRMHILFVWAYDIFGKWGAVGVGAVLTGILAVTACFRYVDTKRQQKVDEFMKSESAETPDRCKAEEN